MYARRELGVVLDGLAEAGYDAEWTEQGADNVEAPQILCSRLRARLPEASASFARRQQTA